MDGKLTLSLESDVDILEHLHGVRTTALLLGVEQNVTLLGHSAGDHVEENGSEGLLHVRADPDEEPVVQLHGSGENSSNTRSSADSNTTAVEMREVEETGELQKAG